MKVETIIKNYKLLSEEDKVKFKIETGLKKRSIWCNQENEEI